MSTTAGVSRIGLVNMGKKGNVRTHRCEKVGPMQMEIGGWGFRVIVDRADEGVPKEELIRVYQSKVKSSSVGVHGGGIALDVTFDDGGITLQRVGVVVEFTRTKTESAAKVVKRVTQNLKNFLTIVKRRKKKIGRPAKKPKPPLSNAPMKATKPKPRKVQRGSIRPIPAAERLRREKLAKEYAERLRMANTPRDPLDEANAYQSLLKAVKDDKCLQRAALIEALLEPVLKKMKRDRQPLGIIQD